MYLCISYIYIFLSASLSPLVVHCVILGTTAIIKIKHPQLPSSHEINNKKKDSTGLEVKTSRFNLSSSDSKEK